MVTLFIQVNVGTSSRSWLLKRLSFTSSEIFFVWSCCNSLRFSFSLPRSLIRNVIMWYLVKRKRDMLRRTVIYDLDSFYPRRIALGRRLRVTTVFFALWGCRSIRYLFFSCVRPAKCQKGREWAWKREVKCVNSSLVYPGLIQMNILINHEQVIIHYPTSLEYSVISREKNKMIWNLYSAMLLPDAKFDTLG